MFSGLNSAGTRNITAQDKVIASRPLSTRPLPILVFATNISSNNISVIPIFSAVEHFFTA